MRFSVGFGIGPLRASQSLGMPRIGGRRVGGAYRELNETSHEISGMWFDAVDRRTSNPRGAWDLFVGVFMLGLTTVVTAFLCWFLAYIAWELSGWWWLSALLMLPAGFIALWLLIHVTLVIPWEVTGRLPWQSRSTPPDPESMRGRRSGTNPQTSQANAPASQPYVRTYDELQASEATRQRHQEAARRRREQLAAERTRLTKLETLDSTPTPFPRDAHGRFTPRGKRP